MFGGGLCPLKRDYHATPLLPTKPKRMDLVKMIPELKAEKQRFDQAIAALERLFADRRRPGWPTKWLQGPIRPVAEGAVKADEKSSSK
jgi:hypothetical protein